LLQATAVHNRQLERNNIKKMGKESIIESPVMPLHINRHHLRSIDKCKPFPSTSITEGKSQGESIKHDYVILTPTNAQKEKK
jgi:hypothetical protein